ncbi:ACT domain-containing protein [Rubeoparvulum massiliense]|uniref:ACT domain-containing protein n=1 Tax=Rubeoparvulum massiliense TaxID=1631346 RepID=UPI0009E60CBF
MRGDEAKGPLDFALIGILASISTILAQRGISIFAISTYDTDYILVKEKDIERAIEALIDERYEVVH